MREPLLTYVGGRVHILEDYDIESLDIVICNYTKCVQTIVD